MGQVCLPTTTYIISTTIVIFIIVSLGFAMYYYKEKTENVKVEKCVNDTKIEELKDIIKNKKYEVKQPINIIKQNPIETLPERRYIGRNDYSGSSQQVGFIFNNNNDRFPLYENRRDTRYYYHVIDGTRNGIRIVVETRGDRQLSDGEVINVPELSGDFTVKLYEYSGNRYNPFVY